MPTHFSFSLPSSAASSRNSSPAPATRHLSVRHPATRTDESSLGRRPVDVYDVMLPRWRAVLRKHLLRRVDVESKVIARMQVSHRAYPVSLHLLVCAQECIRTPFLDAYFVYTSSLGTHTFFMTAIPALYFFGYEDLGGGCVTYLAFLTSLTNHDALVSSLSLHLESTCRPLSKTSYALQDPLLLP